MGRSRHGLRSDTGRRRLPKPGHSQQGVRRHRPSYEGQLVLSDLPSATTLSVSDDLPIADEAHAGVTSTFGASAEAWA